MKTNVQNSRKQLWQIRPSCLFLALVLIGVPWILVVGPGETVAGGGTSGSSFRILKHGWPAAHAVASITVYDGVRRNGAIVFGAKPPKAESRSYAERCMQMYFEEGKFKAFDFRLTPERVDFQLYKRSYWQESFWTNDSWPYLNDADGYVMKWRPTGLVFNFCFLLFAVLLASFLLQLRTSRRQGLWRLSLSDVLVLFLFSGTLTGLVTAEYRRAAAEQANLKKVFECSNVWPSVNSRNGEPLGQLPKLLVNLLDNRCCLPGTDVPLFIPAEFIELRFLFENVESPDTVETENDLIEGLNGLACDLSITSELNEPLASILRKVDPHLIKELRLSISGTLVRFGQPPREHFDEKLLTNLSVELPELELLEVALVPNTDQSRQVETFADIAIRNQVEYLRFENLNFSGADCLINSSNSFPRTMRCYISNLDDTVTVSQIDRLDQEKTSG